MEPVPLPLVGSEIPGKYSMDSSYYIINPFSKKIDAAMVVIEEIAEMSKHYMYDTLLYKDMESYKCDILGCKNASIKTQEYNEPHMFSKIGTFLEKYEVYFSFPGTEDVLDVCNDYMKDNITLEDAIDKMKRMISIVQRENTK